MSSLAHITRTLSKRRAKTRAFRRFMVRSAVAIILHEQNQQLQVLLIKRAEKSGDRWSGHVAFPGGRAEQQDANTRQTALRETMEEIGLEMDDTHYLGRLSDVMTLAHGTKKPMVVSPYVFKLDHISPLTLNHEVAEVFWLPLSFLKNTDNRESMDWKKNGIRITLPCYFYEGKKLWGLTLVMLDELMSLDLR